MVEFVGLLAVHEWRALTDPRLSGWVSSSDPCKSGSMHMIYQMSGNVKSFLQNSSVLTKEISLGEAVDVVSIDINWMTQQAFLGSENGRFIILAEVSAINPDGIGILRGVPNLDVAGEFVTFFMSKKAQSLWMRPVGHPDGAKKFGITRISILPELYEGDLINLWVPLNPFKTDICFTLRLCHRKCPLERPQRLDRTEHHQGTSTLIRAASGVLSSHFQRRNEAIF